MSFINKKCLQTCFLEPYSYNFGSLLGGGVAVCLFLSAHRAVIFAISQLSCLLLVHGMIVVFCAYGFCAALYTKSAFTFTRHMGQNCRPTLSAAVKNDMTARFLGPCSRTFISKTELIIHAGGSWCVDRVFSCVCYFVCLCVCLSALWKKNDLSYQHQTWHTYTQWLRIDSEVKRSKVKVKVKHADGCACRYDCLGF